MTSPCISFTFSHTSPPFSSTFSPTVPATPFIVSKTELPTSSSFSPALAATSSTFLPASMVVSNTLAPIFSAVVFSRGVAGSALSRVSKLSGRSSTTGLLTGGGGGGGVVCFCVSSNKSLMLSKGGLAGGGVEATGGVSGSFLVPITSCALSITLAPRSSTLSRASLKKSSALWTNSPERSFISCPASLAVSTALLAADLPKDCAPNNTFLISLKNPIAIWIFELVKFLGKTG